MMQNSPSSYECKYVHNESDGDNTSDGMFNAPVSSSPSPTQRLLSGTTRSNETCGQYKNTEKLRIVFIDWDDTLCPTFAIFKTKGKNSNVQQLQLFGQYIYELLVKYIQLFGVNNIYIVTNGSNNWVHQSLIALSNLCKQSSSNTDYFAFIYNVFLYY